MPSWIVPSDSHVVSDTGHTTDHNHVADDLTLVNNVLPVVSGGLPGAVQVARFAGATTSGAPVSGTFAVGDFIVDRAGTIWQCTAAGSPGTWGALVNRGAAETISGVKTFTGGIVLSVASGDALVVSSDGTKTSAGAMWFTPSAGHAGGLFMLNQTSGVTFALMNEVANAPAGVPALGGFGHAWVVAGATALTSASILQVSNSNGDQELRVQDDGVVLTHNNTVDDGSGNMAAAGGLTTKIRTITASATLTATDSVVLLNAATLTATLPTAVGGAGREYTVKLIAASTATVATTSSQTIDGSTTYSLSANHKYVSVVSDGANWQIVANN